MADLLSWLLDYYPYLAIMLVIAISFYGVLLKANLFKKIVALMILTDAINLFFLLMGYKKGVEAIPPIAVGFELSDFAARSVDPLTQYFVLTAIVIGMAEAAALLTLALLIHRYYGTLDVSKIRELRG